VLCVCLLLIYLFVFRGSLCLCVAAFVGSLFGSVLCGTTFVLWLWWMVGFVLGVLIVLL